MMGIKRLLTMKAMCSCSTDRTTTFTELRLIPSVPDPDACPTVFPREAFRGYIRPERTNFRPDRPLSGLIWKDPNFDISGPSHPCKNHFHAWQDRTQAWGNHYRPNSGCHGPERTHSRPENARPRPERSIPDIGNPVQDLRGSILGLREPILSMRGFSCALRDPKRYKRVP